MREGVRVDIGVGVWGMWGVDGQEQELTDIGTCNRCGHVWSNYKRDYRCGEQGLTIVFSWK